MDTSIMNTLSNAMRDELQQYMITAIADDSKADLVREGLHQQDPTRKITLLVHPARSKWPHMLYVPVQQGGIYQQSAYEIGGGISVEFRRHFIVELKMFYRPGVDREESEEISNVVLSRAEDTLWLMPTPTETDSFGECATGARQVFRSFVEEGGGPKAHNWQGEISMEWLTHKERVRP